ncbi:copper resistance protein NlpE [Flavobacterium sp. FlaQc-52]|jgi:hypothetical protein|uniref:copper resistance protein NlpE n=1 Tax=Flavobacterium sp. FlaQc-52 TaxID=3374185 RepID=UPI0037583364
MKKLICIATVASLVLACNSKKEEQITTPENEKTVTKTNERFNKTSVFEGVLPCADCSGIKTTLKIDADYGVAQNNRFELITVYQGKEPEKEFSEKGNFNIERGLDNDPDGTIYVLNWDQPLEKQIYYGYYSANPEKIYLLDRDRKIIKSELNYFLTKRK